MKRKLMMFVACLFACAVFAQADQITFSFVALSSSTTFTATNSGVSFGSATNIVATDANTGVSVPLAATVTGSSGDASSYTVTTSPNLVIAVFEMGSSDSVLIEESGTVLLSGVMSDKSNLISTYPNGTGAFLSDFDVTAIDPTILALFGLSGVSPNGSVSVTFGSSNVIGPHDLASVLGGGTITVEGTTAVPEDNSVVLLSVGLVLLLVARKVRFQ